MDTAPQGRTTLPRPSKLPVSRSILDPSKVQRSEASKSTQLPLPKAQSLSKAKPLRESVNPTARRPHGSSGQSLYARHTPVKSTFAASQASALETTPPNQVSDVPVTEGDENPPAVSARPTEKRRPRPSLSERTVETLSRIPPTPSPSRRRSSIVTNSSNGGDRMGPPNRPASALRGSRPISPSLMRSPSPSKRAFRPPGTSSSPSKNLTSLSSDDSIHTPPRAFLRDRSSRNTKTPTGDNRSISDSLTENRVDDVSGLPEPQPNRAKSMHDLRASAGKQYKSRTSMSGTFKDHPPLPNTSIAAARQKPASQQKSSGPTSSHRIDQSYIEPQKKPARSLKPPSKVESKQEPSSSNKSSGTLRETIAKARAAKKATAVQEADVRSATPTTGDEDHAPMRDISSNPASLAKKLEGAVTSGTLNLSAASLRKFPLEVLKMYDFNEDSNISWSEAVDLVKFIAADNEIQQIPDGAFPDWSEEELLSDPDKSNMFAGLEVLDLHGNHLDSVALGFRRLTRLQKLNLSLNRITSASLSPIWGMSSLRELRLANNMLSGALPDELGMLTQLQVLDLSNNQLIGLPSSIGDMKSLQKLLLGSNQLSVIPTDAVLSLPLIELNLSRNKLDASILGNTIFESTHLQNLDISGNNLSSIAVKELILPALQTLSVHGNRLETLPDLSQCQNLLIFNAADNRLPQLPLGFLDLPKLRSADLSNNQIKTLDPLLCRLESLTAINLAGNPMRERKYLTMNADDVKADLAKKLAPTDVGTDVAETQSAAEAVGTIDGKEARKSHLYQPKNGILDLSSLGLSSSDVMSIDFNVAQPIHTLRLSHNNLTALPVKLLSHSAIRSSLTSLDISHNPTLHPTDYLTSDLHLPKLQHLYIVSTGITWLNPLTNHLSAPELKELNISCHRLSGSVPKLRTWFPRLTSLLATDNWFHSLDVEAAQGLEVLDVTNNQIEALPPKIGLLGSRGGRVESGKLRSFECSGNRFRVPRIAILEKGTEAVLRDLRRMIPEQEVPEEWKNEV